MKRTVNICDIPDCGAVLIHPQDGFIMRGAVLDSNTTEGEQKVLVQAPADGEIALCREHAAKALNFTP